MDRFPPSTSLYPLPPSLCLSSLLFLSRLIQSALGLMRLSGNEWSFVIVSSLLFTGWMEGVKLLEWSAVSSSSSSSPAREAGEAFSSLSPHLDYFFARGRTRRTRKQHDGGGGDGEETALLAGGGGGKAGGEGFGTIQS